MKLIRILLLVLLGVLSNVSLFAYDFKVDGIYYNKLSSDEVEVANDGNGNSYFGIVIIPKTVIFNNREYIVTAIGNEAFSYCNALTSITIPNSVKSIEGYTFTGCSSLTSITIPNSVTSIGSQAFWYCRGLTSITIPNSVINIGEYAFGYCSGLTSLTIPNSVTSIGYGAFLNCTGLASVVSNIVNPFEISNSVFSSETLLKAKLYVPAGTKSKYQSMNYWNQFTSIEEGSGSSITRTIHVYPAGSLPNLISESEKYAIEELTLTGEINGTDFRLLRDMAGNNYLGQKTEGKLKKLDISGAKVIAGGDKYLDTDLINGACIGASGSFHFQIMQANEIPMCVFFGCYLTSIIIPNSVMSIGNNAFRGCCDLTSIIIPNSVTSIGSYAFCGCSGLTTITIPSSVTNIGNLAFDLCSGLTSIKVESGNTKYDSRNSCNAIIETFSNTLIVGCKNTIIPNSVTSIGNRAFDGCSDLATITIPNSVNSIGDYAFQSCRGLTSITIPSSVTSIGSRAFIACSGLTSIKVESGNTKYDSHNSCNAIIETFSNMLIVGCKNTTIPNSVTSIGSSAFYMCGLSSIMIPNSVTSIGEHAFYGCTRLTSITIPNSVTSIGEYAFQACSGLMSITIPSSVRSIGNGAFENCNNLIAVTVEKTTPISLSSDVFSNRKNATLYVPVGSKLAYAAADYWKEFKYIVEMDENVSLSISSNGNGTVTYNGTTVRNASQSFNVEKGTSASITFTPDNGYRMASLYVNSNNVTSGISNNKYTISNISSNTTVEVTFEAIPPTTYTLSIKATGSGSASYNSTTIRGKTTSFTVNEGMSATITFTPDNGYRIASLYVNSNNVTSSISNNKYTISNISRNTTVEVTFEAIPPTTYTLSIKSTGSGSVSYNSTTIRGKTTSFTVNEGTSATITFTPDNGYRIASLYVNSNNVTSSISNNKYTISNISRNTTVEVTFEAIPVTTYTLSIKTTGGGLASYNGTTIRSKTSSFTVNEGTSVSITLTPDNGYRIKSVKENNTNVTSYVSNSKYTINSISRNTTVEVEFEAIPATTYTLSIKSVGNGSANYNSTVVRGETSAFAVSEGASATITLYPDEGYSIKNAIVDNTDVLSDIRNNKITLQNISHDILVNIHFENKCDSLINAINTTNELVDNELANCRQQLDNLKKLIEKAKEIDADGFGSYETKYNEYGVALGGIEENARILKESFDALLSSYNEYGIEDSGDEYINGYAERFDYGLKKAKELLMLIHEREDDINTTYSQLNDELNNLPQTITYTMSVTSSGNGYASYGGVQVRNTTTSFTVNEGTTVTITFVPDNGYQIASVKLNNSDVTAGVSNNSYTINNIKANTILEVVFEAMPTTVIADGVNFNITSQTEQTVSVANGSYGQVLTVPATVTGYGKTWTVTGVEANALSGNTQLAAVIWNPEVAFTATVSNPNLLLYVKAERYAPSTIQNVVVNGTANSIVLTEAQSGNSFYCPQEFTARRISYTHNYKMTTGIGESRGWETIALPFDVQTITHATKGEIVPFANWTSGSTKKPFWLYQLTGSGFKEADAIKAYTPYILSMPNNSQYGSEWLLNGSVTFSATNVTIHTTDNVQTATYSSRTFVPNYADRVANEGLYALNVVNDFVFNNSGMTEGSKFVLNMRQVHPFEAYMTSSSNARTYFDIFDDLSTDIKEEFIVHSSQFLAGDRVFDLQGRKVEHPSKKGVYIVNGKKMVVK